MRRLVAPVLVGIAVITATPGIAQPQRPSNAHAAAAAALFALGEANGSIQILGNPASGPYDVSVPGDADFRGGAITPSGRWFLEPDATYEHYAIEAFKDPRSTATATTPVMLQDFTRFFKATECKYCDSYPSGVAAAGNNAALVATDSSGLIQLRRGTSDWTTDNRVRGAAIKGKKPPAGLIELPRFDGKSVFVGGIAASTMPLRPGAGYLAVGANRYSGTLTTLTGIGTSHPRVASTVNATSLVDKIHGWYGNGGVSFSPATPTRAAIVTADGFAILNLSNPKHPTLQSVTDVGAANSAESVAVSPDGNDVAVAVGDDVDIYSGLLTTPGSDPLTLVTSVFYNDTSVTDVDYLSNGTILDVHGSSANDWNQLGTIDYGQSSAPAAGSGYGLADGPNSYSSAVYSGPAFDEASTWPPAPAASVSIRTRGTAKVGRTFAIGLSVAHGIGTYHFSILDGHLPAGMHLKHAAIRGRPTEPGTFHVRLLAANQYGGTTSRHLRIHIAH